MQWQLTGRVCQRFNEVQGRITEGHFGRIPSLDKDLSNACSEGASQSTTTSSSGTDKQYKELVSSVVRTISGTISP